KRGSVLLEEVALAVVPHSLFLLDQLTAEQGSENHRGPLLVVGDVRYGQRPATVAPPDALAAARPLVRADTPLDWHDLPATRAELEAVASQAGDRPVLRLTGVEASTDRLLAELPKARWAHVATHGFFADREFRASFQLNEALFQRGVNGLGSER